MHWIRAVCAVQAVCRGGLAWARLRENPSCKGCHGGGLGRAPLVTTGRPACWKGLLQRHCRRRGSSGDGTSHAPHWFACFCGLRLAALCLTGQRAHGNSLQQQPYFANAGPCVTKLHLDEDMQQMPGHQVVTSQPRTARPRRATAHAQLCG